MKNIIKRIIAIACCILLCFSGISCSSCSSCGEIPEEGYKESDTVFIKNGSSKYKILVSDDALEKEVFAAQELQYFLKEATDCEIKIISYSELKDGENFLSIGQTECLEESNIEVDSEKLGGSGYRIVTKDDNVYMFGADDGLGEGTIYSVYGFLNAMVNYVYYSDATIYYDEVRDLNIKIFDLTKIPRFEIRYVNTMKTWNDVNYMYRMRWTARDNLADNLSGHTHFMLLNPDVYYEEHPDWYYYNETKEKPTQLCYSNKEMRKELSKQLLEHVKAEPTKTLFSLGVEDNEDYCDCPDCQAAVETYGSYGGLYINFCNEVTEESDAWLAKNQPNRKVEYSCQIYYATEEAPVTKTDSGYQVVNKDAVPKSNLRLIIASIGTRVRNKALDDDVNANVYETYKKWGSISKNIQSYNYAASYYEHCYMYAVNDFVNVERDMELYEQNGVRDLYYTFGYRTTDTACLYDMKAFCISQLMWGTEKSYQELARDFMDHSYLDAADALWSFYEDYRMHMLASESNFPSKNTGSTARAFTSTLFPRAFIDKLQTHIDAAYQAISKYETENPTLYKQLKSKINKEEIMLLYMYLELYEENFTVSQRADMIARLGEYSYEHNILRSGENWLLSKELDAWSANLI